MVTGTAAVLDGELVGFESGAVSFDALQMPFLINSYPLEGQVIGGDIGKQMLTGAAGFGVVGLAIHEGGLRKPLGVSKKLVSLADFKGLKMRSVESPVLSAGLQALGANPTTLPVGDIFAAMQNHTVDGMEANLGLIQTLKLYEVAKYVTNNVNLWPFPTVLIMNKAKFDGLSADQRKAITARSGGSSGARSSSTPCGRQVMLRLRPSAWVSSSSCV